jgi:hypothetical protein
MIIHFSRIMIFVWFSRSIFSFCSMIISTPIPTEFLLGFLIWGFHSHFIIIKYIIIGGPIGRNVVCFSSTSCFSPYNNSPPYLCFPFVDGWYTYNRSCIRCGFFFLMIVGRVFNIRAFIVIIEMCNLVFTRVWPFYIMSFWPFYFWFRFSYFGRLVQSKSFIEFFMTEAFHEDLGTISSFHMFTNLSVTFLKLSLYYAQWLLVSYNVSISRYLRHYIEFDTHTIVMLEQLFNVGSFGGSISHLVHR